MAFLPACQPCLPQGVYAPFKTDTDQRVADSLSLNTTASEWRLGREAGRELWVCYTLTGFAAAVGPCRTACVEDRLQLEACCWSMPLDCTELGMSPNH